MATSLSALPLVSSLQERAARLARELALYAEVTPGGGGKALKAPRLAPGTPAFAKAARHDFAQLLDFYGAPRLPEAFVVRDLSTLPSAVRRAFDAFAQEHGGAASLALNTIDAHRSWQALSVRAGQARVALFGADGVTVARGVITQRSERAWVLRWR